MTTQRTVFVPVQSEPCYGRGPLIVEAPGERPDRVWTLPLERDPDKAPALPITPVHGRNAFLEDCGHDWTWLNGERMRYSGTGRERGGVWLLLEIDP